MRCLNCQTVLMDTDRRCPMCGMATPIGRAAASSLQVRAAFDPAARRQFYIMKWVLGLLGVVVGAALAGGGILIYLDLQQNPPKPQKLTAAELVKISKPEENTDWVSFAPDKMLDTGVTYKKLRSGQETSRFLLVKAQDRWLMVKVPPGFNKLHVEGKLNTLDTVALPQIERAFRPETQKLLPVMIDAEYDIAATQRQNGILAGAVAVVGVIMFFSGLGGLFSKPPPFVGPTTPVPVSATPVGTARVGVATPVGVGYAQPMQAVPFEATPQGRGCLIPTISCIVWMVVFFFGSGVAAALIAGLAGGGDPDLPKQWGEKLGPWLLLGSIVLAILLSILGVLPGTRHPRGSKSGSS